MSPARSGLSACVVAKDEEDRIDACLASLGFCDEIVVVDAHSCDRTREIAAARGARVIERDWPGHVAQKEFAIRAARHDFVLCVDCDERVSPSLRAEVEALRGRGFEDAAGWRIPRLSSYLGAWIRHGRWHPDLQLRLFDRRRGHWTGRDPHDRAVVDGPVAALSAPLLHQPYRDFEDHLATIDRYTTIAAQRLYEEGRRARLADVALRPGWSFLRAFLLERGCLDGWRGLVLSALGAHYVRLKWLKLWLLARALPPEPPP
jgi:glycosyltransferase involved in cell wall biosynthesis